MDEKTIAFQGEVMLLGWADTSTRGKTVTFQLPEDGDMEHPFRHFTLKAAKRAGQRFMAVLVQVDDDERPVEKTPAQLAFLLCRDQQFWHWASERSFADVDSEAAARAWILEACKVSSRSQLDTQPFARQAWEAIVWQPWQKYRATLGGI